MDIYIYIVWIYIYILWRFIYVYGLWIYMGFIDLYSLHGKALQTIDNLLSQTLTEI